MRLNALSNLAMSLVTRFDHLGLTEDLDETISLPHEAGAIRPDALGNDSDVAEANVSVRLMRLNGGKR